MSVQNILWGLLVQKVQCLLAFSICYTTARRIACRAAKCRAVIKGTGKLEELPVTVGEIAKVPKGGMKTSTESVQV